MSLTWSIKGGRELDAALGELAQATAKNVLVRAGRKAMAPVAATAKRLAPKATGRLAAGIVVTTKKPVGHQTKATYVATIQSGGTRAEAAAAQRQANRENDNTFAEVFVAAPKVAEAWPQELGTAHHKAQPYMRPAWEQHKVDVLQTVLAEIKPEINKAAERARRKALKAARG